VSAQATRSLLPDQDTRRCLVRFGRLNEHGIVEFSFGVDSAELMVDLVLPLDAYREFCRVNHVVHLTREEEAALDRDQTKWRYGSAGVEE
jgi:phenol hydroxylase P0 protein